jgi:hypothetical protein
MNPPFQQRTSCVMLQLAEAMDPHGAHMEYKDEMGVVFARMAKVYKKGWLLGFFSTDPTVYGELKDAEGNLLLTTICYYGNTERECKVEVFNPDKTLLGLAYDASHGLDFELPDGTLLGKAKYCEEMKSHPSDLIFTFVDAADQIVGTGARRYPNPNNSLLDNLTLTNNLGMPVQFVNLEASVDPVLHTFLFLFPALQRLRFSRHRWP